MKTLLVTNLMRAGIKARYFMNAGVLLTLDVGDLKKAFNVAIMGFGAVIALKGVATLSEGQGEQSSAAKSQGYGYLGGAVVFIAVGLTVVEFLFKNVG